MVRLAKETQKNSFVSENFQIESFVTQKTTTKLKIKSPILAKVVNELCKANGKTLQGSKT